VGDLGRAGASPSSQRVAGIDRPGTRSLNRHVPASATLPISNGQFCQASKPESSKFDVHQVPGANFNQAVKND